MDETIRTRALSYTRSHWKIILSSVATAIITSGGWLAAKSFDAGKRMSDDATLVRKIDDMASDIKRQGEQQAEANLHLARMDEHMTSIDGHIHDLEDWRNGKGVPVFSTNQGHRAKH